MPRGDGTGPMGMGPMTGRAAGYCAGYGVPGYANPIPGRGFWGRGGRGGGRGWRNWYYATGLPGWARAGLYPAWGAVPWGPVPFQAPPAPAPEQEASFLRAQAENLRAALESIEKRLQELEQEAR
ncbi:MAG: DUF5320 domain-containing protein [Anaerolineae bacterium]|nr:DUF5320 domain-containing protein [Anaerolineae bacterium]